MRILGQRTPLDVFRLDLVYLIAALTAEEDRPQVQALATPLVSVLAELRNERGALEQAEEILVSNQALLNRRDDKTDKRTTEVGGIARAAHKDLYPLLFTNYAPSAVGKLALGEQLKENERIQGIIASLDPTHPLHLAYQSDLGADISALKEALASAGQANTALKLAQVKIRQLKAKIDTLRVQTHGELLKIFGNKEEPERFFRKTNAVPSKEDGSDAEPAQSPTP